MTGTENDESVPYPKRWIALVFIALAQLTVALDTTIVNIALPSAQQDLAISDASRQWVITAYSLAFAGLLLLGGRVADQFGRRRTYLIGLVGFALASALGGLATDGGTLIAARGLQGGFAALLSPATLSMIAVTFTRPKERAKAFAVYGGIAGSGAAIGLMLGGVLTQFLGWRSCLYVNVPIAIIACIGARFCERDESPDVRRRLDVAGAVLVTGGLVAVVYACSLAVSAGWESASVILLLVGGVVLLGAFVVVEYRGSSPLLPLRIVANRVRSGAYLSVALAIIGMFGLFLFLTYYFQVIVGYSPVLAGLAFLPMSAAILIGSGPIASRLMPTVPMHALVAPGFVLAGLGMLLLTNLTTGSNYLVDVLPAEILLGLGMGCIFTPAMSAATQGVDRRDAGIASAAAIAATQTGAAIGTALLNSVAAGATGSYLATQPHATAAAALVHGYVRASAVCAVILFLGAVLALVLLRSPKPVLSSAHREPGGP